MKKTRNQPIDEVSKAQTADGERSLPDGCPRLPGWAAVVNSRQAHYLLCGEEWILKTVEAVRDTTKRGNGIITSLGMNTWELSLWAAGQCGAHVLLVIPEDSMIPNMGEQIAAEFDADPGKLHLLPFSSVKSGKTPKRDWPKRDEIIFDTANEILPVSVRDGGNLRGLIDKAESKGKKIDTRCSVSHGVLHRPPIASRIDTESLQEWTSNPNWSYLTHWTRSFAGPWPGERAADYYKALFSDGICEGPDYPRSAWHTLIRILTERKLRSSSFRIRGDHSVVAFTAQNPKDVISRMRYRRRFQRWNFEPYAIAIRKQRLVDIGAQPVQYLQPGESPGQKTNEVWIQGNKSGKADWSLEAEWRLEGCLNLNILEPDDVTAIVRNTLEIPLIQEISPWRVRALT